MVSVASSSDPHSAPLCIHCYAGAAQADDQAAAGPGEQAAQGTAGAAGGHGISRYWRINGRAPAAGQGLAEVADALQQLPTSFERVRWSKLLTDVLKQGVLSEASLGSGGAQCRAAA